MAIYGKKNSIEEGSDNIFWTTMADLMLGLAIIFMTLFILAISGFTQETVKMQQEQIKASKELVEKLEVEKIEAEVDFLTGNVKISDIQLFDVGSYALTPKGKKFLDKFIPIYFDTIFKNSSIANSIEEIVIQGHTDSQSFKGARTPNEQYSKNMFLSLQRAYAIQDYLYKTNYDKSYDYALRKMIVTEGKSFSEPILNDKGEEDFVKSRRVEFRLKVKSKSLPKVFGLNFNGN